MRMTLRHVAAVATLVLTAACKGDEVTPETTGPNSESKFTVVLSAQTDTVPEASTKRLTARVADQAGRLQAETITWTSTNPNIASVSNGTVTGISLGEAAIIASARGAADTALIVVTQSDLILDVQPSGASVVLGDTVNFSATVRNRDGNVVAVDSFVWNVSDTTAAKFVGPGSLVMQAEGELDVSAEAMQRQGVSRVYVYQLPVASVTITPGTANVQKGESLTLQATLRDQFGRIVKDGITWGSSDFSKVKITQEGVVTGMGVGSAVVTATSDGKTGSATINVLSVPATSVIVSFPSTTLPVGSEMQATATPLDAQGQPLTGKTIAWQSANPAIATVTSTGKVKGISLGSTSISAIVDGIIKSTPITIATRIPSSITITPNAPSISIGQQSQLEPDVFDQNGAWMGGQSFTWSSSNPGVATVSANGMLVGVASGTTIIKVTSGSLTASATATVVNVAVSSVRISPTSLTLNTGTQGTLSAQALDANQNVLNGRIVTWSSQNPTVATVSNAGLVTAVNQGTAVLTATIEGKTATASVTVNPTTVAVATVSVQLGATTLNPGQTTQATAILKDASGNILTGRTVTWTSVDTAVAKVSTSGLVTAYKGGTVAIIAKNGTVQGSASLTVNTPPPAPVARIEVTAPDTSLLKGETVQSVVKLYDANNNILTGRTITYASENSTVISVSATGMVTAVNAGSTRLKVTSGTVNGYLTFAVAGTTTTVASIAVTPASSNLTVGGTTQASAVAKDANGATVSGTTFTWTTSNAAIASVSSSGMVSAVGAGTATITAAAAGKTGTMAVTVTAPPAPAVVASVSVSMSTGSVTVGGTSQATAVAKDANGAVISGKTASWSLSSSALASVSTSGLVTGLAAGTVTVTATIDGKTGSNSVTITAPSTGTPLPPLSPSVAQLPKVFLNYTFPAKTGNTINVAAGGDLQAALNSAQRGDEIVLAAGATFTGNYTLPAKSGTAANGWIVIRSAQLSSLPAMGNRVAASHASMMPKIVTPNVAPALKTAAGTSGWWMAGIEVTVSASLTAQQYGLLVLGDAGAAQNSMAAVPQDIVLDRMYIHGQTNTNVSRCVALNSGRTQITDSFIVECHGKGFDSQAVGGWNGPGPFKIVNNLLMGAGENVFFGGADPSIPNLVPSDIEIRRNHIYTPASWKGVWTKKNLLELKNASRVLIEANVFDGSWLDGQTGWAMIIKSENQGGGCPWCRSTDVTIQRNVIKNAGAGISLAPVGPHAPVDSAPRRIVIRETTVDNIGVAPYTGDQRGFQVLTGITQVTIERTVLTGSHNAALALEGGDPAAYKDNIWARGGYGVIGTGTGPGSPTITRYAPGSTWSNMNLVGTAYGTYPAGFNWVSSEGAVPLAAQIRGIVQQATSGVVQVVP